MSSEKTVKAAEFLKNEVIERIDAFEILKPRNGWTEYDLQKLVGFLHEEYGELITLGLMKKDRELIVSEVIDIACICMMILNNIKVEAWQWGDWHKKWRQEIQDRTVEERR